MSIEAAVVIGKDLQPLFWHTPNGCGPANIPDSRDLWFVLWENRENIMGVAHTHPDSLNPQPSYEDLTTFAAVESGLGRRLLWWILTSTAINEFAWKGPGKYDYGKNYDFSSEKVAPDWVNKLRQLSYGKEAGQP